MRLLSIAPLLVTLAGCRTSSPTSTPDASALVVGSNAAPPAASAAVDAAAPRKLPPELLSVLQPDQQTLVLGPFAWPPNGAAAIAGTAPLLLAWKAGAITERTSLPEGRAPLRALQKDLTGDGAPELVVLLGKPAPKDAELVGPETLWIFGVRPDGHVARMTALEVQMAGVSDEAGLEAELANVGKLGATTDVAPERVVARLEWATPDELRAMAPSKGLKLCHRQATRTSCSAIAKAQIAGATAKKIIDKPGKLARFASDEPGGLLAPHCETKKNSVFCNASVGGPDGGFWVFERTSSGALELTEVGSWAEDS